MESCCICDKEFSSNTQLADHLVNHVYDKEYKFLLEESSTSNPQGRPSTSKRTPVLVNGTAKPRSAPPEVVTLSDDSDDEKERKQPKAAKLDTGKAVTAQEQLNLKSLSKIGPPYECPTCKAVYKDCKEFHEHVLSHGLPREHRCHICNERFAYRGSLKQHLEQHIGQKVFKCKQCPKKFSMKKWLTKHEENAHRTKRLRGSKTQ